MISLRHRWERRVAVVVVGVIGVIEGPLSPHRRAQRCFNPCVLTLPLQVMVRACRAPVDVSHGWTVATTSTSDQPFSRRSMIQPIVSYGACRNFAIAIIRLTPDDSGSARMR